LQHNELTPTAPTEEIPSGEQQNPPVRLARVSSFNYQPSFGERERFYDCV